MTEATLAGVAARIGRPRVTVPRLLSTAILILALSVLLGWWLEHPGLRSGIAGLVAMNPVTAVAFLLASTALRLRSDATFSRYLPLAHLCAACVILLALLCLTRFVGPWDLGPDRLLFADQLHTVGQGWPNRMAPNTALNFLLLGVALLSIDYRTKSGWRPAEGLAIGAGTFALVAIVGYLYGSRLLYGVGSFIPMAVNTAMGFLLLAVGVLWARPQEGLPALCVGSGAGTLLVRRLLPAALLVPLVLGWLRLEGERHGLYDTAGGVALLVTTTILIFAGFVWRSAVTLDRAELGRSEAERRIRELNDQLELRVERRTFELNQANAALSNEVEERRRAQEALHAQTGSLRQARDELRALLDASPLAICSLTREGSVRSWNRAAEELFGWTAAEVVGGPLVTVPAELLSEHRTLRDRVLAGAPFTNYETRRVRKDGKQLDVSVSTAALHGMTGAPDGVVVVYMDIGAHKTLEHQLRQAQKMEAVGRLAGGIAHDFNNMLTVIRASAEFLMADLTPEDPRRADAAEVYTTADRAASLTRQLLAFSRQQVLQPRVLDLNHVIGELGSMVRRLVEEHITVETRLPPDLGQVYADRSQLDQVLLNLVVNARDAMPSGGRLLIETANVVLDDAYPRSHLTAQPGPHVVLSVTDTGCGMDPGTQARIFEPFFTTKGAGQGTGLGLATVYGIVKQSGGHIWVYSEAGRGTSFKIYFPRHAGAVDAVSEPDGMVPDEPARGETILVVEDDPAVRSSVRRLLERQGYAVLEASAGQQALAILAEAPSVDLVISDMVMPEMGGLELRERLQAVRPGLPLLLMSGYSADAITRLGRSESVGLLIEKPFTVTGMLHKIRQVLAVSRAEPNPPLRAQG